MRGTGLWWFVVKDDGYYVSDLPCSRTLYGLIHSVLKISFAVSYIITDLFFTDGETEAQRSTLLSYKTEFKS